MTHSLWPNKYQKLFVDGGDNHEFAHFGWGDLELQTGGYRLGYKLAADTLIDNAISSKNNLKLDTFIFPIIFLYRQYVELTLKDFIISLSNMDSQETIKKLNDYNHNLEKLWKDFSSIHNEYVPVDHDSAFKIVGKYVQEFIEIDKGSFSFRYPFTKKLERIFREERRINLPHLKNRMTEIEFFFNGTGDYIYDLKRAGE